MATDKDLAPADRVLGNLVGVKYLAAHRELVIANRALQRLSARCERLKVDAEYVKQLQARVAAADWLVSEIRSSYAYIEPSVVDAVAAYEKLIGPKP